MSVFCSNVTSWYGTNLSDISSDGSKVLSHQFVTIHDPKEEARLAALRDYEILDTAAEQAFDRLTQLAATFYASPIALISLVDRERQWFKSRVGLEATETPRNLAFCHHAIQGDKPFIVNDATKDERFRDNPLVTGAPDIRFYAGAPLVSPQGQKIGTLCIIDQNPRQDFQEKDTEQLTLLAEIVISEMELRIKNSQLEQAMTEVEKASQARSHFLSSVSHEIRTPLSGVIGLADALSDTQLDSHGNELVEGIKSSSQILMGLLNDVLDFAKIEAGKFQIHRKNIDLRKYLMNLSRIWENVAMEKGLNFQMDIQADLPEILAMDELRFTQIINNILSNAVKFTKEGSILVVVSRTELDGLAAFQIEISDTGNGMSEAQLSNLFTPFEQADGSIAQEYGGTGLGMAITKSLVSLLGGEIDCQSTLGEGTCFTLKFQEQVLSSDGGKSVAAPAVPQKTARILIVDDVDINRMIAKHIIEKMGHVSAEAKSGKEAISQLRDADFDLVLMDLYMPGMSGIEAANQIKAFKPSQRIVSLSADDTVNKDDIQAAVMDGNLIKPLTQDSLAIALAS
ncbi:MAG: response regulator [Sneathiella sp.]|nr:response regulator [Sneathiella sp.]